MDRFRHTHGRRDFLKFLAAFGATAGVCPRLDAAGPAYDPAAVFDLTVSEIEFRRNAAGRMLMA